MTLINEIFIKNGFRKILSCSLSSTVFKIFLKASEVNIKFSVTALESVWNNKSYGLELMKKCHESNINCVAVKDTEIPSAVQESDCALVGADAIIAVGGAVNGFPSLGLSHSCKNVIPFYIAAESFKFTKKYIVEDGFEYIPSDLITKIITDEPALWGEISDL